MQQILNILKRHSCLLGPFRAHGTTYLTRLAGTTAITAAVAITITVASAVAAGIIAEVLAFHHKTSSHCQPSSS